MKKYTSIIKSLLIFVVLVMNSCSGEFIPDPIDPRLPKYTEEGNNVAGAFINDNTWESVVSIGFPYGQHDAPSITAYRVSDSLVIRFTGNTSSERANIEFHLTGLNINKFEDLLQLKGRKIQVDGFKNVAYYINNFDSSIYTNKGIGQIYFKSVIENEASSSLILSGTFGFSVYATYTEITKISYGRFDYRITESSNFQLE